MKTKNTKIAASILAADFSKLAEEIEAVSNAPEKGRAADWLHFDVMDGHFVPNITFGPDLIAHLRPISGLVFDVHLMIEPVSPHIEAFARAGADYITIHAEASRHINRDLAFIKSTGKKAGLALNPATPVEWLYESLEQIDLILIMSVNPGFGGQEFIPQAIDKLGRIRNQIGERQILLSVDGGVTSDNASLLGQADILVAGSSIYKTNHPGKAISALRKATGDNSVG